MKNSPAFAPLLSLNVTLAAEMRELEKEELSGEQFVAQFTQRFHAQEAVRIQALSLALIALEQTDTPQAREALKNIEALAQASVPTITEAGWILESPEYGQWFFSKRAVIEDWKRDRKEAYPGEPEIEPDEETIETWFCEQITWIEIALEGMQLRGPDFAAEVRSTYRKMLRDTDLPMERKEVSPLPSLNLECPPGCEINSVSSRMCERGTKACVVEHGKNKKSASTKKSGARK